VNLLCPLGFHRRSRGRAHWTSAGFVSVCARCGAPMRKLANGRWVRQNEAPPPVAAEQAD
jgi:hypothetical protein